MQATFFELDQIYIIIDALEECEECVELMRLVKTVNNCEYNQLPILVTSLQLPEIEDVLTDCDTVYLLRDLDQYIHVLIQEYFSSDRKF